MAPIVEYRLEPVRPDAAPSGGEVYWAYEADLEAWEESM